jgi:hypothetical protein
MKIAVLGTGTVGRALARRLSGTYPDFQIDADAEQALLAEHDVIVFQHPVYWYNTTPFSSSGRQGLHPRLSITARPRSCPARKPSSPSPRAFPPSDTPSKA